MILLKQEGRLAALNTMAVKMVYKPDGVETFQLVASCWMREVKDHDDSGGLGAFHVYLNKKIMYLKDSIYD